MLWRRMQPPLLRYLRVLTVEDAEDVAAETWLHVARDLSNFRGDGTSFRVWLFRIARNRAMDDRRRCARRREDLYDTTPESSATAEDAAADAMEALETAWAVRMIAALPRDQAEAVMLRVVGGLDVAQTAAVLGKRPGAVRIAALRGLRRLAQHAEVQQRRAPGTGARSSSHRERAETVARC